MGRLISKFDKSGASSFVPETEWIPMRLSDAASSRVVTRIGSPVDVFDSYSTAGNVNIATLSQNVSNLTSGTGTGQTSAAVFSFPIYKSDGQPLYFSETWGITFYLNIVSATVSATDNDMFVALGLFDGDTDLQGSRLVTGLHFNNATGPRVFSAGPGLAITSQQTSGKANLNDGSLYVRFNTTPEMNQKAIITGYGLGITSAGAFEIHKHWTSTSSFQTSTPRESGQVYAVINIGRSAANANNPEIQFEAFYCMSDPTSYEGRITSTPSLI